MKKKILFLSSVSLLATPLFTISCINTNYWKNYDWLNEKNSSFKIKEVPFENLANKHYNINNDKLKFYFKANELQPYVSIEETINNLNGLFDVNNITKTSLKNEPKNIFKNKNGETMVIDYQNDFIWLTSDYFFDFLKSSNNTNYARLIKNVGVEVDNKKNLNGNIGVLLDLAKYNIDIIQENENTLIPFSIFNTLFCSQNYYNLYYNGDIVLGAYFDLSDNVEGIEDFKNGSLSKKQEKDIDRLNNYNNLLFTLDYFYGLKKYKNINNFNEFIEDDLKQKFLSLDPNQYNEAYSDLFYEKLNELHTSLRMYSFHTEKTKKIDQYAKNKSSVLREHRKIRQKLNNSRQNIMVEYDKKGFIIRDRTAYIIFNGFETGSNDDINNGNYKNDTFETLRKKLEIISKSYPKVKNIIFDISLNGGGNIGAMLRILGLLTNKNVQTHSINTLSNLDLTLKYEIDANKDNNYSDSDAFSQFNYYLLTSNNTFSAANAFAGVVKELEIGKIIGQKSGGGTSSIMPIVMQDGTSIIISSQNTSYYKKNDKKINLEFGVDVDIEIDYDDFYKIDYLITKINE